MSCAWSCVQCRLSRRVTLTCWGSSVANFDNFAIEGRAHPLFYDLLKLFLLKAQAAGRRRATNR